MATEYIQREQLIPYVQKKLIDVDIVLDIGCGIRPQNLLHSFIHICAEPFEQYRKVLEDHHRQKVDNLSFVIDADWRKAVEVIPDKSVDTIFLLDVIEHLEKKEGIELLKITEKKARKQIIIFTPLGFMPQHHPDGKDAWGLDGGTVQEHKSGWDIGDFDDSWDLYISKDFHTHDSNNNLLEKPFGAFFAIKTFIDQKNDDKLTIFNNLNNILTSFGLERDEAKKIYLLKTNDLFKSHKLLILSNTQLQSQYAQHQSQYAQLQSQYTQLQEQHTQLQEQHTQLENSKAVLLSRRLKQYPIIFKIFNGILSILFKLNKFFKK